MVVMVILLLLLLLPPDHPPLDLRHPRGVAAVQVHGAVVRRGGGGRGRGGVLLPPEAAEGGCGSGPLGVDGGHIRGRRIGGRVWRRRPQGRGTGGELGPLLGADAVVDDPAGRGELHPVPGDGGGGGGGLADGRCGGGRGGLSGARGNAQGAAMRCEMIDFGRESENLGLSELELGEFPNFRIWKGFKLIAWEGVARRGKAKMKQGPDLIELRLTNWKGGLGLWIIGV